MEQLAKEIARETEKVRQSFYQVTELCIKLAGERDIAMKSVKKVHSINNFINTIMNQRGDWTSGDVLRHIKNMILKEKEEYV